MIRRQPSPLLKIVLEVGPVAVFFLAFQFGSRLLALPELHDSLAAVTGARVLAGQAGPLFVATAAFMVVITLSLCASWALTRTLPRMAVLTGIVVVVFGGLTLVLRDDQFIKMKPTIVNGLFALILGIGLLQRRSYLKYLLSEAMPITDAAWMIFTRRWAVFFIFLAVLNEAIWRTQSTEFWVAFKTFGNLPLTFAFMLSQWPFLARHMIEEEQEAPDSGPEAR